MCGISGIIGSNSNRELEKEIIRMTDAIIHRGPDGFGYYHHEKFAFGHRRLAILDLTSKGAQPMEYQSRYVITYNGEIYNYLEIREELLEKGYHFNSETDTEVIMAAYDYWGKECLDKFNGMWAFAIFDKQKNIIFCSRDRFGVKPFYFTEIRNKFIFSSEIKQLTCIDGWQPLANKAKLYDFLQYSLFDHTNETLFKNVYQLRGGHYLIYDLNTSRYKVEQWYDLLNKYDNRKRSFVEARDQLKSLLIDAVKIRLRSDVKVGSCLSGGLDSTTIVCIANRLLKAEGANDKQETISSCFDQKQYDEQEYINEVIDHTGVNGHKIFPAYDELFEQLDTIAWHQDEPYYSSSIYAQWCVFKGAKDNNIIVMLDGQGADEQLAGYDRFHNMYLLELLSKMRFGTFIDNIRNYQLIYNGNSVAQVKSLVKQLVRILLPDKLIAIIRKIINNNNKFNDYLIKTNEINIKTKQLTKEKFNIRDKSIKELLYTSLPMLLHYEDRDSMAHSVESRVPFVDYRIIEFIVGLPSDYKINNSVRKYILREAMREVIPDKVINRYDKMGFVTPEEIWICENAPAFRSEIIEACERLKGIIDKKKVLQCFDEAINSEANFGYSFWKIISVGRWVKVFNVKIP